MKGKASDICTKCKHCEGLDMFAKMYSCKHYNNYPDAAIGMDSEIECCNFEEVNMNKVEGKVSDWCPKCKDETIDESVSCIRDIPSDVEMIEDLKKRAAVSDYYKEMSESLEEKLKNANEVADSWKRDYERIREQFLCPIYDILYPDNPNLDINVTDLLADVKNLKVYGNENEKMYKELQEWREKCISRGNDIDHLLSENKEKDREIGELKAYIDKLESADVLWNART